MGWYEKYQSVFRGPEYAKENICNIRMMLINEMLYGEMEGIRQRR